MRSLTDRRCRSQISFLRRQFLQGGDRPFGDVLSKEMVSQALASAGVVWKQRIYSPLVTLWVFLSQVLSADHSCRAAVARLQAHRVSQGECGCSAETGAYCQARKRLPEKFFATMACLVGRKLDAQAPSEWLWKGRRVYLFDGSTVSMPDTTANQDAYPQHDSQRAGLGFPMARIAAIFSLSCGTILDLGVCRYAGKGQGELSVFRRLMGFFRPGDVVLSDRLYCTWRELLDLQKQGVHAVSQLQVMRKADFRKGKRLGKGDHIVQWPKPTTIRSVDWPTYRDLPDSITVRECRVIIGQAGFRNKAIIVVTTLLDPEEFTKEEIAVLYRARWNAELDLRSVKTTMQMEVLRCKTPELVRKEIWTHVLAYNLIRTVMAQAASEHSLQPRAISFKGAMQTLEAFRPLIACSSRLREQACQRLLACIATHSVAHRPGRFEPRQVKRRPKRYQWMMVPRLEAKLQLLQELA
jgi:hypothetical protein